jgi:hypothetical protein
MDARSQLARLEPVVLPISQLLTFWKDADASVASADAAPGASVAEALACLRDAGRVMAWSGAIEALRRVGTAHAVEALGCFLRTPHARATHRRDALLALGQIGTPEAVAAIADFEGWADHRRALPQHSPFGHRDDLLGGEGTDVAPTACLTDGAGATWAIYREPGAVWAGDWLVTWADDGHTWADPVLVGPSDDPAGLLREIAEGRTPLATFQQDTDGDGLTDLEEARLGTDPMRADSDDDARPDGLDGNPLTRRTPHDLDARIRQAAFTLLFATCECHDALLLPRAKPLARQEYDGYVGWVLPTPAARPGWYHVTSMRVRRMGTDEADVCVVGYGGEKVCVTIVQVACKHGQWVPVGYTAAGVED